MQEIKNLLNSSENEFSKYVTKKWYVIESESNGSYLDHDPIKFLTKSIECIYLVIGNIAVAKTIAAAGNNPTKKNQPLTVATQVASKNCAAFKSSRTEINDTFVDEADFINIAIPMYNLMEYSDNYSDTSGSLLGLKRWGS